MGFPGLWNFGVGELFRHFRCKESPPRTSYAFLYFTGIAASHQPIHLPSNPSFQHGGVLISVQRPLVFWLSQHTAPVGIFLEFVTPLIRGHYGHNRAIDGASIQTTDLQILSYPFRDRITSTGTSLPCCKGRHVRSIATTYPLPRLFNIPSAPLSPSSFLRVLHISACWRVVSSRQEMARPLLVRSTYRV